MFPAHFRAKKGRIHQNSSPIRLLFLEGIWTFDRRFLVVSSWEAWPPRWVRSASGGTRKCSRRAARRSSRGGDAEYDAFAKLASNENNCGPPESVMKAMNDALEVRQPLRLPGRQHRAGDRRASRRQAREHPADRRLRRGARGRRHDVPAGRQEGARRRARPTPRSTSTRRTSRPRRSSCRSPRTTGRTSAR